MKRRNQIIDSKERIANAFITLLKDHDFQSISIKDISDLAEIARMTFYRHFDTKEDVLQYILSQIIDTATSEIQNIPTPSIADLLCIRFNLLKQFPYLYWLKIDTFTSEIIKHFQLKNLSLFQDILPYSDHDYLHSFCMGGMDYVTRQWIENGMVETSEEMTHTILDIQKHLGKLNL